MLSDTRIDEFVACARFVRDKAGRAETQRVVTVAAEELGIDAKSPPVPRYNDGEDSLSAACRLLKLPKPGKAVEEYQLRRAALEQVKQHYGKLSARRRQLVQGERARIEKEVRAGHDFRPSTQKARDELHAVQVELDLIGNVESLDSFYPSEVEEALRAGAIAPAEWYGVTLYLRLLSDSLLVLTERDGPRSKERRQALSAAAPADSYERTQNTRMGSDPASQAHYVALRAIRVCVESADLHERLELQRRAEEQGLSIEERAAARELAAVAGR